MLPLLPHVKNISGSLLGDDLVGVKPGEPWEKSLERHFKEKQMRLLKERNIKIRKIRKKGSV